MWVKLLAGNLREVRELAQLFNRNPVDVMHVSVSGYEVAGLACRRIGIPTVAMNMITPPEEQYWFRRFLMRYTQRRYDHVSSQSRFCTQTWAAFAGLPSEHCSFVWNGADLERFRPKTESTARDTPTDFSLISLGRLHPMKGYLDLVEAMRLLDDPDVRLCIFGEGEQRPVLEDEIRRAGLEDRVTLGEFCERPEEALAEADCFVLPSVSHESCPAVLAEAMACGLPLITSDFGPLAEVNVHEETGLVVPVGRADLLADAIKRLKSDRSLSHRMGTAGRHRALEFFSRDRMVEETVNLYERVLDLQGRAG